MTTETDEKIKSWERHISTIASTVVIALLIWLGSSVIEMGKDISTIKVKLEAAVHIQQSLDKITLDHAEFAVRYEVITDRITDIEKRQDEEDKRERKEHNGGG